MFYQLWQLLGGVTALFSATVGMVQNDIKRVIAYSTCSQLGYMVLIAGLSQFNVVIVSSYIIMLFLKLYYF